MYNQIYDKLRGIPVIDTHEHLWDEQYRLQHIGDWSTLFYHYCIMALKSAGMTKHEAEIFFRVNTPHSEKWSIFSKYFLLCKNTAYVKSVLIAINEIYGINRMDSDSMEELTNKMQTMVKPGFHRKVLRELGGIEYCMVNCFDCDEKGERYPARVEGDLDLFRPDLFADGIIYPAERKIIERLTGIDTSTFSGWLKAVDRYFDVYAPQCCAVKIAIAYSGSLDFKTGVTYQSAEHQYKMLLEKESSYKEVKLLAEYMFHYILNKASEYKLTIKFHTGLYSGAGYAEMGEMELNVRHLAKLAMERPDCNIVAMHIGYPFQDELVMAIKLVTNLYADMSWIWVVDPIAASLFLKQALTAAPVTKITGFGGDYAFVENAYGHLQIARMQIAQVLNELVEIRYFDEDEAVDAGSFLLRHSAERLYTK